MSKPEADPDRVHASSSPSTSTTSTTPSPSTRKLFGTEPAKRRPGYANFAITEPPLKLVLLENPGQGGTLNHLGVEVADTDTVDAEQTRLAGAGLASVDERDTTCCYAKQDKFWVQGAPNGERWEIYTVLADSPTPNGEADGQGCCSRTFQSSGPGHRRWRPLLPSAVTEDTPWSG